MSFSLKKAHIKNRHSSLILAKYEEIILYKLVIVFLSDVSSKKKGRKEIYYRKDTDYFVPSLGYNGNLVKCRQT